MLHGCEEDAPTFAAITGMRELGEKYGFAVVFPNEPSSANGAQCWNWFDPSNLTRGTGELSIITGMMGQLQRSVNIDMSRIYVGGISAGAGLASNLIACYSDLFAGGIIHSGLMYEAANSSSGAFMTMSQGSSQDPVQAGLDAAKCTGAGGRVTNVMIVHGSQDTTVNPKNSDEILQQMTKMNDMLDDGQNNNSQNTTVIATTQATAPGSSGESYTTETYGGRGKVHITNIVVQGMGHAWSGAHASGEFTDPNGPDVSEMFVQFMNQSARQ